MSFTHEDEVVEGQPLISTVAVLVTATPLPATPTEGRNALLIRNPTMVDIILCNADGSGCLTVEPGESIRFLTKDVGPLFYARSPSGTATIEIMEWR